MEKVTALKIRNNLGEILDRLEKTGEPILVSKGRKVRAVLVTPEQFERRFLDWQTREEKRKFLENARELRKKRMGNTSSLGALRRLRGYED